MKKKYNLLHYTYKTIKERYQNFTIPQFMGYVIPSIEPNNVDANKIGNKLRGKCHFSQNEIDYYLYDEKITEVKEKIENLIIELGSLNKIISNNIILYLKDEHYNTDLITKLSNYLLNENYEEFYYELFKYCMLEERSKEEIKDKEDFQEFFDLIIRPYGISGITAQTIITQMSRNTENPYILYEAGEIEYTRSNILYPNSVEEHIGNAYKYYKKASNMGFALAYWSLGYMARSGKAHYIDEFSSVSKNDRMELAKNYFQKAAQKGCVRAYNSLGNIESEGGHLFMDAPGQISAEYYYEKAAHQDDVYGMYNYGRILEKKLKLRISDLYFKNNNITEICFELQNEINEMFLFIKNSADKGYPVACYRTALYYSDIVFNDEKTIFPSNVKHPIVEYDNIMAKKYFKKAIDLNKILLKYRPIEEQSDKNIKLIEAKENFII